MNPEEFERELETVRNPRKPSAYLLVCWVALADGKRDPRQLEVAGNTIGAERVEAYSGLAEKQSHRVLQLACGIIAEAPPTAQLAVLIGGIRAAVANEELAIEESIVLRFLGELTGQDVDELFEEETGIAFPGLPGGKDLLAAVEDSPYRDSVHNLLALTGKLRKNLSLPDGGWWDEVLATEFGPDKAEEEQVAEPGPDHAEEEEEREAEAGPDDEVSDKDMEKEEVVKAGPPSAEGTGRRRLLIRAGVGVAAIVLLVILISGPGKDDPKGGIAKDDGGGGPGTESPQPLPVSPPVLVAPGVVPGIPPGGAERPAPVPESSPGPSSDPATLPSVDKASPEWLVQSGSRSDLEEFLARNPGSLHFEQVQESLIDLELRTVMEGAHEAINQPVELDQGAGEEISILEVVNEGVSPLTVLYRGEKSYRLVVPPGETKPFVIQNGIYSVAVTGAGRDTSLLGRHELLGGRYSYRLPGEPASGG